MKHASVHCTLSCLVQSVSVPLIVRQCRCWDAPQPFPSSYPYIYLATLSTASGGLPVLCLSTDVTFGVCGGSNAHNTVDHYVTDVPVRH